LIDSEDEESFQDVLETIKKKN